MDWAADLATVRYEGARPGSRARRGHVESWFLKANDPVSRRAVWLRWTVWAGDRAPAAAIAETWAVAYGAASGPVAVKVAVPFAAPSVRFAGAGLGVSIDGCELGPRRAAGRVESGGRAIAYDLAIETIEGPLQHFPSGLLYARGWPPQKVTSPIASARLTGTIAVEGEAPWRVEGWPGMVGHNWGRGHAERYAWTHCNAWDEADPSTVVEAVAGRAGPRLAAIVCVRHAGRSHDLNRPLDLARSSVAITPRRLHFHGRGRDVTVDVEVWAETDDLVGLHYPNPDGTVTHCLNSKLARAEVTLRVGDAEPIALRSSRAALEIGTRDPYHGVRMVL